MAAIVKTPMTLTHKKSYILAFILAVILSVAGISIVKAQLAPLNEPFSDVDQGSAFYKEISWMYAQGITNGSSQPDGSVLYSPSANISREAMAAFLYRFAGSPAYTPPATSPFSDVSTMHVLYREIAWLYDKGVTTGTINPDGTRTFSPNSAISREAVAAFLYRSANM